MLLLCYCVSFYASSAHLLDADSLKALCFQPVRPSVRPSVRACVLMCVPGRDILRLTSTSSLDIFVVFNFYLVYDVIVN